jgi:hypothetical protein
MRTRIELQCDAVVDAESHCFNDIRGHIRRRGYRVDLLRRKPPDPGRSRSGRKIQRAGNHTERCSHTAGGRVEPGVDDRPGNWGDPKPATCAKSQRDPVRGRRA